MKKILCLFLIVITILSNSFSVFSANTTIENPEGVAGAFEQAVTAAPITITSIKTDLASPQRAGTKIRWTCTTSGGTSPVYFFKIYKGTAVVTESSAYSTKNYFDWTPSEEGTNYRALVYVKEAGSTTSVTKLSDYYIVDNNTINKQLGFNITDWIIDDQNGYIYAISKDNNALLFIRLSDLSIEKSIAIGSWPCDIDMEDGNIYVALSGATQIKIVDIAKKAIEKTITTTKIPCRIAVDGNKLFYTQGDQYYGLEVCDMRTESWEHIALSNYYGFNMAIDRENHILYIGEPGYDAFITTINTNDYSKSIFKYDQGYGFASPERKVIYDDGDVFFIGYSFDAVNPAAVNGYYMDAIIYVKGNYVFSSNSVYDRNKYVKIRDLPMVASNVLMDDKGYTYMFDSQENTLYKQRISYKLNTSMRHTNTLNNVVLDEQLTSWVSSEDGSYIYAVSQSGNKLLFIRAGDLTVEKELYIGSMPSDIELANGYLYIALSGSTKVIVIDPATGGVIKRILLKNYPYKIAVDGYKLFYTRYREWSGLFAYDMSTGNVDHLVGAGTPYEADLAVDRTHHILFSGESKNFSRISAFSTTDYSVLSYTNNDFQYPKRGVVYDDGSVYYAGRRLDPSKLTSILGTYNEHIIYARGAYVFSGNHIFDRDSYLPVVTYNKAADLALMLNDGSYLLYNDQARSVSKNAPLPSHIKIVSIAADKASPQSTGTKIRWTCNITGGYKPVYYFKIFKGSTLVKSSTSYTSVNYFDWTPTEAGTDYRAYVYVKEKESPSSTAVSRFSGYFTVAEPIPIVITSIVTDKPSPRPVGLGIRWTCNITGGVNPVYYFKVFKGSTLANSSKEYTATNYFDWKPAEEGSDYRVYVYVKENGCASSTAVTKLSSYFTVYTPLPLTITSIVPDKESPQPLGSRIRWTCNISGGIDPLYSFDVLKGTRSVRGLSGYSFNNYIDWTPQETGSNFRVLVYVKNRGSDQSPVVKYSSYFTVTSPLPITITSLEPDKASPQTPGSTIRWTCKITGGFKPEYYFKVFNGSTLIQSSTAYTSANYFDWTPAEAGDKYRVIVYVRENILVSSSEATKVSDYYTVTAAPAPAVTESPEPELSGIKIIDPLINLP